MVVANILFFDEQGIETEWLGCPRCSGYRSIDYILHTDGKEIKGCRVCLFNMAWEVKMGIKTIEQGLKEFE